MFNELDNAVAKLFPSIITARAARNDRRRAAMTRLLKWECRKMNESIASGDYKAVSDFADAISDLSFRMSYK